MKAPTTASWLTRDPTTNLNMHNSRGAAPFQFLQKYLK
jgi:hypothetical protein